MVVHRQILERATRTQAASATRTTSIHFVFASSVADAWSQPRRLESRTWSCLLAMRVRICLLGVQRARRGSAEKMHRYISWIAKAGFKAHPKSISSDNIRCPWCPKRELRDPSLWLRPSSRSAKQFIRSLALSSNKEAALLHFGIVESRRLPLCICQTCVC